MVNWPLSRLFHADSRTAGSSLKCSVTPAADPDKPLPIVSAYPGRSVKN